MSTWRSKVSLSKLFDKDGKKAAASEFNKSFNKEEVQREFEEKKVDLEPGLVELYEASPPEIKALIKDTKAAKIKKSATAVTKFLEDLTSIEFPGAKQVGEAAAKSGPALVADPITFLFGLIKPLVVKEEPVPEPVVEAAEVTVVETVVAEVPMEEAAPKEGEAAAAEGEKVEMAAEEEKEEATTSTAATTTEKPKKKFFGLV